MAGDSAGCPSKETLMKNRGSGATIETATPETTTEAPTAAPPTDPFEGVTLRSPLLQVMQQLLGPYLSHKPGCSGIDCPCGLRAAVSSLSQREMMITRYGSIE
jgi:hypothetical protein